MNIFIAFLRGINVGGHKKIKMANLRAALLEENFLEIHTYIQSGNLVFKSSETPGACEIKIIQCIEKKFGFTVPTLVLSYSDLKEVVSKNPFTSEKVEQSYYTLLSHSPEKEAIAVFLTTQYPEEEILLREKCVYFHTNKSFSKSKYSNNIVEKKLKVEATTRNHRTMTKMVQIAEGL